MLKQYTSGAEAPFGRQDLVTPRLKPGAKKSPLKRADRPVSVDLGNSGLTKWTGGMPHGPEGAKRE